MLVIMVKLFKVLEHKKVLLQNLTWLNDEGERMQMLTRTYPTVFQASLIKRYVKNIY